MSEPLHFIERAYRLMAAIGLGQPGALRQGQDNPLTDSEIQHQLNQQAHRFTGAHCLIACYVNPEADIPFLLEVLEAQILPSSSTAYVELVMCHPSLTVLSKKIQKEVDATAELHRTANGDSLLRGIIFTYRNLIPELEAIMRFENGMKLELDLRDFCVAHVKSYLQ